MEAKTNLFVLKDKINETNDVATLKFSPVEENISPFISGQFVNVYFLDDRCGGQGKPYSISSIPGGDFLSITVKKIGKFSGALHDLKIGEKVKVSEPQGYFYPEDKINNVVFLAGGIGITPFYSIIKNCFKKQKNKNIVLFYSNKTRDDAVFLNELKDLANNWSNFKIINVFTREKAEMSGVKNLETERIGVSMIKKYLKTLNGNYYFICGSIGFVRDLWKELKENEVQEDFIKVESFY